MNYWTQIFLLASSIMFTPISDDALMVTFIMSIIREYNMLIIWLTTWIVCAVAFSWFYLVGRLFRHILSNRILNRPTFKRANALFNNHGSQTILASYFLPGLRHPIHYIAGFNQMSFWIYQRYNIISAACYTGLWTIALTFLHELPWIQSVITWLIRQ